VITGWITNFPCCRCELPPRVCIMEVRYPGVCPGAMDRDVVDYLERIAESKRELCMKK